MQETSRFNQAPSEEDCRALQATQKAHVLFVPDRAVTNELGIKINMGAALLDNNGVWLTAPEGEGSYGEAYQEVFSRVGFGFGP